jgi:hypothetical protein
MLKLQELTQIDSCLNKALNQEMIFVLLARDAAAPEAIRAWCQRRILLGLNTPDDPKIREALQCAETMENTQDDIDEILEKQHKR